MSVFPKNCDLTFSTTTVSTQKDRSGNPIINKVDSLITCSVRVDTSKQDRLIAQPGEDPNIIYFVCYAIKPKYLPAIVRPNATANCEITDLASGSKQAGVFTVTMITQSKWKQVPKALGHKFEGYLIHA
jgi:uncharacterized protein (UPF0333 family)